MAVNVHVIRRNTLGIPRGLYLDWMGNNLSDANANQLIADGAAILCLIPNPLKSAQGTVASNNADGRADGWFYSHITSTGQLVALYEKILGAYVQIGTGGGGADELGTYLAMNASGSLYLSFNTAGTTYLSMAA